MENLSKAFVALQADLTPVAKSAVNPFFKAKYAPLPEVMETIQPLLAKHKLAVMQPMTNLDGQPAIKTILIHESGQMMQEVSPIFLNKQDAQSHGSAITYARRYGVMSLLGLVADDDDDGNKASKSTGYTGSSERPASEKQLDLIRNLASRQGLSGDLLEARLADIKTSEQASEAISKLKGE